VHGPYGIRELTTLDTDALRIENPHGFPTLRLPHLIENEETQKKRRATFFAIAQRKPLTVLPFVPMPQAVPYASGYSPGSVI
jgi:hypothetical protein